MTLDEILKEIKDAEKIVILTHESPDGDAIGSSLAVKLMLENFDKNADVIIPEYSRLFNFLPAIDQVKTESEIKKYDLAISVDCADLKRLAKKEYFEEAKKTIVIDHHGSNKMYGDLNYVNPVSPACCEILAGMFEYFEIDITKEIGTCIMTGIITDTGGFRHAGINPETFEFTAELIRKGVDIPDIYKRALRTKTKANFLLTKKVIERMEILEDGKVTFKWRDYKDNNKMKEMTITVEEFIRRFLIHILPPKFMKIRYYGILGNRNKKKKLLKCKILTRTKTYKKKELPTLELLKKVLGKDFNLCPQCKKGHMLIPNTT